MRATRFRPVSIVARQPPLVTSGGFHGGRVRSRIEGCTCTLVTSLSPPSLLTPPSSSFLRGAWRPAYRSSVVVEVQQVFQVRVVVSSERWDRVVVVGVSIIEAGVEVGIEKPVGSRVCDFWESRGSRILCGFTRRIVVKIVVELAGVRVSGPINFDAVGGGRVTGSRA